MPATLEKESFCKVNLLLNVLGKRPDGFHELETIMQPVNVRDRLRFAKGGRAVQLSCNDPRMPVDSTNLVHRAASAFLQVAGINDGVAIHLEKKIPLAAGLGGGSGNAATTLLGLNEFFGNPIPPVRLSELAASLGSDVPFFLQAMPALATGRGEKIQTLDSFPALAGTTLLLIHPGFGVSTAWAYQQLAHFPQALNGKPGRAQKLIALLQTADLRAAGAGFYNSLETPVFRKYPILEMYQDFLRTGGAVATLMSGSGSTTFAVVQGHDAAKDLESTFKEKFGSACWTAIVPA
jgi:4-diphosphocytidyl-2-C-methyl-D-erythritol kinase